LDISNIFTNAIPYIDYINTYAVRSQDKPVKIITLSCIVTIMLGVNISIKYFGNKLEYASYINEATCKDLTDVQSKLRIHGTREQCAHSIVNSRN